MSMSAEELPVVTRPLRRLLEVLFVLFALLAVNAIYLAVISFAEWRTGIVYQNHFYLSMFLAHLALGLVVSPVAIGFMVMHLRRAWHRPNRRAVAAGLALAAAAVALIVSGFALVRFEGFNLQQPALRSLAYWTHVITPLVALWLFVLHRLAGPALAWHRGIAWALACVLAGAASMALHLRAPTSADGPGPDAAQFSPSLARTADGKPIAASMLQTDAYCAECHADVHERWSHSEHRFSSFNNPAYRLSVMRTRVHLNARDGHPQASRFCAGCHDPVPLFSGAFDDPTFDVPHPGAKAGITCTSCHAITHVNTPRGNADYTTEAPMHYPFVTSNNAALAALNRQLIKAKPALHKKTFLKPLHLEPEFCGTCHKVHIPEQLNAYRWLRGQNHYDSFLLSGVSGHGAASFYYPEKAHPNCNGCHMPPRRSDDFAAAVIDDSGELKIHDHLFPAANTALAQMTARPAWVIREHQDFLAGSLRVDIFGLRRGQDIDAPLRPDVPALTPGETYLLGVIVRTLTLGHAFTEGTADSNEVWIEVTATLNGELFAASGLRDAHSGQVDADAHFINSYVLDRNGRRIDRRNVEDIFVALYNHQIPPGAADSLHYQLSLPAAARGVLKVDTRLFYRKFDTRYLRLIREDPEAVNDLPVTEIARDTVEFPVGAAKVAMASTRDRIEPWQRWNDYGIGLLRKPMRRQLRQAEQAFTAVERLGNVNGALNLARVFLAEGRLEEAAQALGRAATHATPALPWSVAWLSGRINRQRGLLDAAITDFSTLLSTQFTAARDRGFDFSRDYRVSNALGQTRFERARQIRDGHDAERRAGLLRTAANAFRRTLEIDPENAAAHHNLALLATELDDAELARFHRDRHAQYKADDNARDRAVAIARRENPAANRAAEAVVIYRLEPPGIATVGMRP